MAARRLERICTTLVFYYLEPVRQGFLNRFPGPDGADACKCNVRAKLNHKLKQTRTGGRSRTSAKPLCGSYHFMSKSNLIVSPEGEKPKQPDDLKLMAFPLFGVAPGQLPGTATVIMQGGMELRDYFAGQYITYHFAFCTEAYLLEVSIEAYRVADAMLMAREKGGHKS